MTDAKCLSDRGAGTSCCVEERDGSPIWPCQPTSMYVSLPPAALYLRVCVSGLGKTARAFWGLGIPERGAAYCDPHGRWTMLAVFCRDEDVNIGVVLRSTP